MAPVRLKRCQHSLQKVVLCDLFHIVHKKRNAIFRKGPLDGAAVGFHIAGEHHDILITEAPLPHQLHDFLSALFHLVPDVFALNHRHIPGFLFIKPGPQGKEIPFQIVKT
ncbi:hypothetical protein SDC9_187644 [bioreactor metagenome]|uniref:Uncharacterized protein n=1 Tax=bioreactor metagenome TaxID=1076179 RepID=A0A645HPD9_9ZZZZ